MSDRPDDEIIRPTKERMRKAIGYTEVVEAMPGGLTRKNGALRITRNLDDLLSKRLITPEQHAAGQKYYADHEMAGFSPRVTMRWSEWIQGLAGSPGNLDAAERRVFHKKRWHQANQLLEERGWRKAVHWLVMDDLKIEQIGRKYWGYRNDRAASASGRATVADALQLLAKFYGLVK
jgi:hypothetical protein